jgi:hypothetical protein
MTHNEARKVFDQIAATHRNSGNHDQAAKIEIAREYFTNEEFRKTIEDFVWVWNTKAI